MASNGYLLASGLNQGDRNHPDLSSYERKNLIVNFASVIKVIVGKEQVPFIIHNDILVSASEYFKAACKEGWLHEKEGDIGVIRLEEDDPLHFRTFAHFAYTGKLEFDFLSDSELKSLKFSFSSARWDGSCKEPTHVRPAQHFLVSLFVYADARLALPFQNAIIDELVLAISHDGCCAVGLFNHVWEHTTKGSTLRRLFIDSVLYYNTTEDPRKWVQTRNNEFMTELLVEQTSLLAEVQGNCNQLRKVSPRGKGRCEYHVHAKESLKTGLGCKPWNIDTEVRTTIPAPCYCHGRHLCLTCSKKAS